MSGAWIFSPRIDLAVFVGPAAAALALLALGAATGDLDGDAPEWVWVIGVLLVDVAHVWSTGFLILDPIERREHRRLWIAIPMVAVLAGVALYRAGGSPLFWRAVAYLAAFHFVRQQWGWVSLYRARANERDRLGRIIDGAAIYAATLYPLLWWHAHQPRRFAWMIPGDFVPLPELAAELALPLYLLALLAYAAAAARRWIAGTPTPGKDLLVATTAITWWVGIVGFDSDYAFTVTNVLTHGVPYLALVFVVARRRGVPALSGPAPHALAVLLGSLAAIAFLEELCWDRAVWRERGWLFGGAWDPAAIEPWVGVLVPLLAAPQLSHYLLDGFIWRKSHRSRGTQDLFEPGAGR
jgi:hypothetical protein